MELLNLHQISIELVPLCKGGCERLLRRSAGSHRIADLSSNVGPASAGLFTELPNRAWSCVVSVCLYVLAVLLTKKHPESSDRCPTFGVKFNLLLHKINNP